MNFSYICEGSGETIVFIHSYLWDKNMWRPQIDFFKKDYKCIAIDLPGHGDSEILLGENNINLRDLAKNMVDFLEKKGVKKYIYVGLSVGGMLAPYMYEFDKEKIQKMVIMDSYAGEEPEESKKLYFSMLDAINSMGKINETIADKVAPMFFSKETSQNKLKLYKDFYESLLNIPSEKIKTIVKMGKIIFGREDGMEILKNIEIPLVFITGEEDIPRPFEEAKLMKNCTKNSKLFLIENAGHISNLENPEKVNMLLKDILKK